eukprot:m.42870 g.42870  ORF g.42870 m.42870 type:complete len:92 (+) comp11986_c0_seq1:125-400(+)
MTSNELNHSTITINATIRGPVLSLPSPSHILYEPYEAHEGYEGYEGYEPYEAYEARWIVEINVMERKVRRDGVELGGDERWKARRLCEEWR